MDAFIQVHFHHHHNVLISKVHCVACIHDHVDTPSGCSPLQLGSISTPEVNSRCLALLNDGSQLVEGIQGDNIIFCYNTEATLQGTVAMAYCNEGYEILGPDMITCASNGNWGELPRCLRISVTSPGKSVAQTQ